MIANVNDLTCELGAGAEWQWRLQLVLSCDHQHIREVDAAGAHPYPNLAGGQRWRGYFFDSQQVG